MMRSTSSRCLLLLMLICLFISVSLLAKWWLFTCGLSSRVSSIGNVSIPGMTADLTRAQRSIRLFRIKSHNFIMLIFALFLTNQHPPGSAHKRGSPASSARWLAEVLLIIWWRPRWFIRNKSHSWLFDG